MDVVPTLACARLVLREWRDSDRVAYRAIRADPLVARYLGDGNPLHPDDADRQLEYHREQWRAFGVGRWAVEERQSGALIGYRGLLPWREERASGSLELGYGFARERWGRGYATEAGLAALTWGFDARKAEWIVATTHPENLASQRVLAKLGFTPAGEVEGQFHRLSLFQLTWPLFAGARPNDVHPG